MSALQHLIYKLLEIWRAFSKAINLIVVNGATFIGDILIA